MITTQMIQQYQHPRFRLVIGSVTIDETDIIANSFTYKAGTSAGGAFAPGGCVVSQCSFAVQNGSGQYSNVFTDGAEVLVYVGYGPTAATATYDLLCTVYVSEVTRRSGRINIQCNDKLRDADKKTWTTYSFPMTVNQIISSAAAEAGITVLQLPAAGGDISVDLRDDEENQPELSMTCRQAIANALLISGNFGLMNAAGSLVCGWYSRTATDTIDIGWIFDYEIADAEAYTGVQIAGQAVTGTDASLYVLSSNAFLTEDNQAAVQARLYDALVGFVVPKISVSAVLNPNLRPGATISMSYPQAGTTMTAVFPLMDVSAHGGMLASYGSSNVSPDSRDDKRMSQREAEEAVARGDYATKKYVDDAIAGSGGGGSGSGSMVVFIREIFYATSVDGKQVLELDASGINAITLNSSSRIMYRMGRPSDSYKQSFTTLPPLDMTGASDGVTGVTPNRPFPIVIPMTATAQFYNPSSGSYENHGGFGNVVLTGMYGFSTRDDVITLSPDTAYLRVDDIANNKIIFVPVILTTYPYLVRQGKTGANASYWKVSGSYPANPYD